MRRIAEGVVAWGSEGAPLREGRGLGAEKGQAGLPETLTFQQAPIACLRETQAPAHNKAIDRLYDIW